MKVIKEEREVVFYVNITYRLDGKYIIQDFTFSTDNKRDLNYLYDARYLIKNKVDNLIKEELLNDYISRIDGKNFIRITYLKDNNSLKSPSIKIINSYIPPCNGCEYCSKAKIENNFIFCSVKNKHYTYPGITRCQVFKTKPKLLT